MLTGLTPPTDLAAVVALQQRGGPTYSATLAAVQARDQDVRRALARFMQTLVIAEEHMVVEALAFALYGEAWRVGL